MANNVKYVIDDGKNKFAAYDAESVDSLLEEKASIEALNTAVEELEGEIEQKANTEYVNDEIARIETIIEDLPEPMIFKGTLGTGGTIEELPIASAINEGFTYKVITAGTYAGQSARVGDVFTSNGSEWVLIPAGDDFNDTWRAIKVNGTEVLNNAISSGAVNFNEGDQLTITFDAETKTLNFNVVNTYTKQEVDDIIYDVLPDGSANGAVANFNTSLQLPIKSMQIDVNAKQDLHGYDYPWTAGAGKNILLKPFVYYSLAPDNLENMFFIKAGEYRFSFSDSTAENWRVGMRMKNAEGNNLSDISYKPNSGMSWRSEGNFWLGGSNSTTKSISITIVEDCYIRMIFGYASTTAETEFTDVQLEKGTTQTSYEPVENICPIEGRETVQIFKTGKNLLNKENYGFVNNGNIIFGGVAQGYANGTLILPAGTYTFSVSEMCNGLYVGDDEKSILVVYNKTFITFTISETKPIRLQAYKTNVTQADILSYNYQLETGNAATTFEQYNGNDFIINLGGTYYGGKFHQDKEGHRQFVVTSKFVTYIGAENESWSFFSVAQGNLFRIMVSDRKDGYITSTNCMCNSYKPVSQAQRTNGTISGTSIMLDFINNDISNLVDWKSNLANNPIEVVYELATPIIIDLPDGEPINTFNGINNFFADSGDTTVTFKQSVNDAINAALNAANSNRMLSMVNMSKGIESEEKEETKEDLTEETNEK